jgi:hypothetical protein
MFTEQGCEATFRDGGATLVCIKRLPALFLGSRADHAAQMRHLPSWSGYRRPPSPMRCVMRIGGTYWAISDIVSPGRSQSCPGECLSSQTRRIIAANPSAMIATNARSTLRPSTEVHRSPGRLAPETMLTLSCVKRDDLRLRTASMSECQHGNQ